MESELTVTERQQLQAQEAVIERGLNTFVEVGNALLAIRDGQLYREEYTRFEDYCRDRWGISRPRAYQLIEAAETVWNLSTIVDIPKPTNEAQARPLSQLPPTQQAEAWQQAVVTAPNGKITAAHVESVVQEFNYKRDNKTNREGDIYTPQGYDACQTPAYAVDPLLPYLQSGWLVWEPAAGEGNIVEALYDGGFGEGQVIASDLLTGQNFFEYEPGGWDCLVTNPPYSIKYKWLERCYQLGRPFALLMPLETLGAQTAQNLFEQYGVEIILTNKRINFKMPRAGWDGGGAQFPVAWFTWKLNIGQQLTYGKIVKNGTVDTDAAI